MTPFGYYALSFFTNAAILIFEITGGRLLAPYLGTSVGVWAGLIAVVLGGMAVGYQMGGVFAEKKADNQRIGEFLFAAGGTAILAWSLRDLVPTWVSTLGVPVTAGAVIAGSIIFLPTVILLAAISPILAKNLILKLTSTARTIGTISALGTLGSIVGAVFTGLVLIPLFGVKGILLATALSLILVSALFIRKKRGLFILTFILIAAVAFFINAHPTKTTNLVADISTEYNRIFITREHFEKDAYALWTSPFGIQCVMNVENGLADDTTLVAGHQKAHDILVSHVFPEGPSTALFLGGCVATFPRYLEKEFPNLVSTIVEIDPGMTAAARKYFSFKDAYFPNISFVHEDARVFISRDVHKYDLVYLDAFGSEGRVPFHLVTEEMFHRVAERTAENGITIVNTHGAHEGLGLLYPAVFVKTAKTAFKFVSLYEFTGKPKLSQNLIIVGSHSRELPDELIDPRYPTMTLRRISTPDTVMTLTDNYAPVEGIPRERLQRN